MYGNLLYTAGTICLLCGIILNHRGVTTQSKPRLVFGVLYLAFLTLFASTYIAEVGLDILTNTGIALLVIHVGVFFMGTARLRPVDTNLCGIGTTGFGFVVLLTANSP